MSTALEILDRHIAEAEKKASVIVSDAGNDNYKVERILGVPSYH